MSARAHSPEFSADAEYAEHYARRRARPQLSYQSQRERDDAEYRIFNTASDAAWRLWPARPENPFPPITDEHDWFERAVESSRKWRQDHVENRLHAVVDGVEFCDFPAQGGSGHD